MDTFGRTENVQSLLDKVEILEAAIKCELHAQDMDVAGIDADIQADMDALEKENETVCHSETIAADQTEREQRVAAVCEEERLRLEEWRKKLMDAKHELAVINSPILILPHEVTAEIFSWHLLMGGNVTTLLLVCKRWTTLTYSSPRLWSRITVTDRPFFKLWLQGAIRCTDLNYLRSVLSHAQSHPLQIEIYFPYDATSKSGKDSSLIGGRHASANRVEAIKLVLDNQVLRRCTSIILGHCPFPLGHQGSPIAVEDMTVLPLLSSLFISIYRFDLQDHERHFIQSLIKRSPLLRHIRCTNRTLSPQDLGAGIWTKNIESYGWIFPDEPCGLLQGYSSLRELGIFNHPAVPLTLPSLQVLRWMYPTSSRLHFIAAPNLHTLIVRHLSSRNRRPVELPSAGSIALPNLRVAIHFAVNDLTILHVFHTPALEHLSIRSAAPFPTALQELFDGSAHMPTPKSLHLQCPFTDTALISVLCRLPRLEELYVAGTIAQDAFWEALNPSLNPSWQVRFPESYPDERTTHIVTPNLKVLLINYSTGTLYTPPEPWPIGETVTYKPRFGRARAPSPPADHSRGGDWTVTHASAVAVARKQAGCPLETLACWSPEKKLEVLIGSLDTLPKWHNEPIPLLGANSQGAKVNCSCENGFADMSRRAFVCLCLEPAVFAISLP